MPDKRIKDLQDAARVALDNYIAIDGDNLSEAGKITIDQLRELIAALASSGIAGVVTSTSFVPPTPQGIDVYFMNPGTYPGFGNLTLRAADQTNGFPLYVVSWNGSSASAVGIPIEVDLSSYALNSSVTSVRTEALSAANTANTRAGNAQDSANEADRKAVIAQTAAANAQNSANAANNNAETRVAKSDVDTSFDGGFGKVGSANNLKAIKERTDALLRTVIVTTWVSGIRLNNVGQEVTGQSAFRTTPLTPIPSGQSIRGLRLRGSSQSTTAVLAFYNSVGGFIVNGSIVAPGSNSNVADTGVIIPPVGATHFRACGQGSDNPEIQLYYPSVLDLDVDFTGGDTSVLTANRSLQLKDRLDQIKLEYLIPFSTTFRQYINAEGAVITSSNVGSSVTDAITINNGDSFRVKNLSALGQVGSTNLLAWYDQNGNYIPRGSFLVPSGSSILDTGVLYPPVNARTFKAYSTFGQEVASTNKIEIYLVRADFVTKSIEATEPSYEPEFSWLQGSYVNISSGSVVNSGNNGHSYTLPIPISEFSRFRLQNAKAVSGNGSFSAFIFFYDVNMSAIQPYQIVGTNNQVLPDTGIRNAPRNARFFRLSGNSDTIPTITIYNAKGAIIQLQEEVRDKTRQKEIMGDSIAQSIGNAFREVLRSRGYLVNQRTVGGETTLDTSARFGSIPFMIKRGITIPASGSIDLVVDGVAQYSSRKGWSFQLDANANVVNEGGSQRISPFGGMGCIINGVRGSINFGRDPLRAVFTRNTPGTAFTLLRPEVIYPINGNKDVDICLMMGTNGGWTISNNPTGAATFADIDNLINIYKMFRDQLTPHNGNFLFMGFYETSNVIAGDYQALMAYFEQRMFDTFGGNYFNIRRYLLTDVKQDLNLTWTAADIDAINRGRIPISVRATPSINQVHLSTAASRAVANQLLKFWHGKGLIEYIQLDPFSPNPDPDI